MPSSASLILNAASEVPDTHVWTVHDTPTAESESIPIIDLTDPKAMTKLKDACEKWGAFQVVGHGIPSDLIDRFQSQLDRLFALPMERKEMAAPERSSGGASGYGRIPISALFSQEMWTEGFTIFGSSAAEIAEKIWPDEPHRFSELIKEYNTVMMRLSRRLMRMMLSSLGLGEGDVEWDGPEEGSDEFTGVLRLNMYPPCSDPDRAMGMAPHTDSSVLTILYRSDASGLQVLQDGDAPAGPRWVNPISATRSLFVILGDLCPILTNGRFKTVLHRVVVDRTKSRISAAHFCGPPGPIRIMPAEKLVDPKRGPCYRGVSWPEYRDVKAKFFQEALESLRLPIVDFKE